MGINLDSLVDEILPVTKSGNELEKQIAKHLNERAKKFAKYVAYEIWKEIQGCVTGTKTENQFSSITSEYILSGEKLRKLKEDLFGSDDIYTSVPSKY